MPTPGPTDTELALLAPGEHVLNKEAVNIAGRESLDNLNAQGLKVRETMNQTKNSLQNVPGLTVNPVSSPSSAPMTGIPQANAAASTMPKLPQIPGMTKQSQGAQSSGNPLYGNAMKTALFPKPTYPGQNPVKVPGIQGFEDGGAIANPYGLRPDGTPKGKGYLGELKRPDGREVTEFSVGVSIDGKEMDIPTLVPTLSKDEIDSILNLRASDPMPENIVNKAAKFAKDRIKQGKPVYATEEDYPKPAPSEIPQDQIQKFEDGGAVIQRTDPTLAQRLKASGQNAATQSAQLRYDVGKQGKSYLQPPTAPAVDTSVNVGPRSDYRFNPLPGASTLAPNAVDSTTVGNVASDIAGAYKGPFADKVKAFFPRPTNTPVPGSFADKATSFFKGGIQGYEDGTPFEDLEEDRYKAAETSAAKQSEALRGKIAANKASAVPEAAKVDPWTYDQATGKHVGDKLQISQRLKDFFNPKLMGKQLAEAAKDPVTAGLAAHAVNENLLNRELKSGNANPLLAGGRMILDAAGNPFKYSGQKAPSGENSPLGNLIEAATPVPELAEAGYFGKSVPQEPAAETSEPAGVTQKAIEQSQTAAPAQDVPLNILGQPVQKLTERGGYMVGTGPNAVEEIPWDRNSDRELQRTLPADEYNELSKKGAAYRAQVDSAIIPESNSSSAQYDAKGHYLGGTSESKRGGAQPYPEDFRVGRQGNEAATQQAAFIQKERQNIIEEQTERAKQEQLARIYELMQDPNEEKRKSGEKFLHDLFPEVYNKRAEKNL